jgi:hypothetical protein
MTTIDSLRRLPDAFDYAQNSQFKVTLGIFPLTEYYTTAVNVPGVGLGIAPMPTPFIERPTVGDTMTFEDFTMTFMVDEGLKNYQEIFEWMVNIGFPKSHGQFKAKARVDELKRGGEMDLYSEITLMILTSKNNPILQCNIHDAFPNALSGLIYTTQDVDTTYLTADVTFSYSCYDFSDV